MSSHGQRSDEVDSIHGRSEKWVIDRDSMNFGKPPNDVGETPARGLRRNDSAGFAMENVRGSQT
jgi:hypothetical protein